MSLLTRRRKSPEPIDVLAGEEHQEVAETPKSTWFGRLRRAKTAGESTPQWSGPTAAGTKALTVALWCLLATGPIAVVLFLLTASAQPATVTEPTGVDDVAGERAAVTGFAEDFVVTWLSTPRGEGASLEQFVVDASSATLPEQPWQVSEATTAAVEQLEEQLWSATVAVTVLGPQSSSEDAQASEPTPERRYFQVGIVYDGGALRAQTLPAPVAAPEVADPAPLDYRYRVPTTDPVAAAAGEFLAALLTGASDVSRYVSPGAEISAVTPPPYTAVRLDDVALDRELPAGEPTDGEERRLLVTATVTTAQEQALTVQYALTTAARDGRWEISSLDPAATTSPATSDSTGDSETGTPASPGADESSPAGDAPATPSGPAGSPAPPDPTDSTS